MHYVLGTVSFATTGITSCCLFGFVAVHGLALIVFGANQIVEYDGGTDSEEQEDDEDRCLCHHPRNMSTMSLLPEVVSR